MLKLNGSYHFSRSHVPVTCIGKIEVNPLHDCIFSGITIACLQKRKKREQDYMMIAIKLEQISMKPKRLEKLFLFVFCIIFQ